MGASDCPKEEVWRHTRLGTVECKFDWEAMISGVFHGPGHCTCRQARELIEWSLEKLEGMSGSNQGTHPHGRPQLGYTASPATHWCSQKLRLGGMSGWARLQYPPMSVRAGGGSHQAGPHHLTECKRTGSRGRFSRGLVGL